MTEFWQTVFPTPGRNEITAQKAEAAGWDGIVFPDTQCLAGDIYSAMCLAAKATSRLKIGTAVTNPITRHAAVTASAISTVQVESGGRAILGIGRGDSSLGYIGRSPAPVGTLDAYVDALQRYLRGDAVDIDGYSSRIQWLDDDHLARHPKPPVDIAATGPRVIGVGARLADRLTFALGANPDRIRKAMSDARRERESSGSDPDTIEFGAYINIACDDDIARACSIVRGSVGTYAHFTGMSKSNSTGLQDAAIFESIGSNYDMANHARGDAGHMKDVPDEFISRFAVTGSTAYCIDRLAEIASLGINRFVLLTGSRGGVPGAMAASQQRLTEEVFPAFR